MSNCRQCGIRTEELQNGLCPNCAFLEVFPDKLAEKKTLAGIPFEDMKRLDEVDRIKKIVQYLRTAPGRKVLVMVDCGPGYEGKGDRWISEIIRLLPNTKVVSRAINSPTRNIESICFRYEPA